MIGLTFKINEIHTFLMQECERFEMFQLEVTDKKIRVL